MTYGSRRPTSRSRRSCAFTCCPIALWLGATPAALRVGALDGQSIGVDVAAALALGLILGRLELAVESPSLSYVSRDRWHALPIPVRLGLLWD